MRIDIDEGVARDYPDLELVLRVVEDLSVTRRSEELEAHKRKLEDAVRAEGTADTIKDEPRVAAYRTFFWSLGIDPTKTRPAAEALVRRIARGNPLPTINTAVDAYNVASVETRVAFAAFDVASLYGDLLMRYAREGEAFAGIGMDRPKVLSGNELVIDDGEALVAIYPYRDADASKLTEATQASVVLGCGVPGLWGRELLEATERAVELLERYCRPE
jgi:DNA/RNA-binding domain of Phe-tRNA-synthetase-like protein